MSKVKMIQAIKEQKRCAEKLLTLDKEHEYWKGYSDNKKQEWNSQLTQLEEDLQGFME